MFAGQFHNKPWYREPWPWLLMALPLTAVVAGFITLSLALRSEDGLVATDYYKEGLAINRELKRKRTAMELNLHAIATVDAKKNFVRLHLDSNASIPAALTLRLIHPTRAGMDQRITLKVGPGGWYEGQLNTPESARWRLVLEDVGRTWRLDGAWDMLNSGSILFSR